MDLSLIPNHVIFGAALPRLGTPRSQARFLCQRPDFGRANCRFLAHRAITRVVTVALDQVSSPRVDFSLLHAER
eukprot:14497977-Heterocapsa_arctica.AAC.1